MLLLWLFILVSLLLRSFELACFCILLAMLLVMDWSEVDWREWQRLNKVTPL